ncbi:MAG: hypothetical protein Q9160_000449 [Pyrenula sp. 1 TL-2023]
MAEAMPIPLSPDMEKHFLGIKEDRASSELSDINPELEKRVLRKCDLRVVPPCMLLFAVSFLDRVNIGNAKIQGLTEDLHMKGNDFNVASLMIFIPFILLEIPSNLALKRFKPSTWMSLLLFGCGIMTMCQGFVQSQSALIGVRILLGCFESGTGPGSIYLMSMYYKRYELPKRLVLGILLKFWMPEWPEEAGFLDDEERAGLLRRLRADHDSEARMDRLDGPARKRCLYDYKIWLSGFIFLAILNITYGTAFFIPTILTQLNWKALKAQYMSIPIYATGAMFCVIASYASDYLKRRYLFVMLGGLASCIGFIILLCQTSVSVDVRYAAVFFLVSGAYVMQPLSVAWLMNNVGGHYKRGIASAFQIGFGNFGGIIASNIFLTNQAPRFTTGYGVGLGLLIFGMILATVMVVMMKMENDRRNRGLRDDRYNLPKDEVDNLGDDHPAFRFNY